ncbi:MAG TPA: glycoside hydrolase family 3 N-terminal domain-containing protein, partial [Acidimicrobiales bacterium]|nr:glycoside hydrolase family 3 N-terminal domain-containing protein [Acidimicrobiales bacterium]
VALLLIAVPAWAAPGAGSSARSASGAGTHSGRVTTRAGGTACQAARYRLEPLAEAERQAAALVRRMTLAQELDLMDGVGPYPAPAHTVGATAAIPSLGVPALTEQDGPAGVGDGVGGVTQLPAPEALAATFDPAAAACYGQVIGAEARRKGIDLVYGPTVNIVRVPQWGRAFESLGEDPVLAGDIGTAEVGGLQRTGTMAQVKHYAVYNQETYRMTPADDAVVGAKALHEIYLRAWDQIAAAGPASVMCSYSTINGSAACENRSLIRDHLDGEVGFTGFVGSDYYAPGSTVGSAEAGLDQEQPIPLHYGSSLAAAVEDGRVPRSTVDEAARRVLAELFRFGVAGRRPTGGITDLAATPGDAAVAQSVAEEGTVLLRNRAGTLPLDPHRAGRLAVVGPAADDPVTTGGGSAIVTATATVSPLAGIEAAVGRDRVTAAPGLPEPGEFTPIPAAAAPLETTAADGVEAPSLRLTAPETG